MPFCTCILITECDQIQNHNVNSWECCTCSQPCIKYKFQPSDYDISKKKCTEYINLICYIGIDFCYQIYLNCSK